MKKNDHKIGENWKQNEIENKNKQIIKVRMKIKFEVKLHNQPSWWSLQKILILTIIFFLTNFHFQLTFIFLLLQGN